MTILRVTVPHHLPSTAWQQFQLSSQNMEKLGFPELQGLDHALLVTKPEQEPKSPDFQYPAFF